MENTVKLYSLDYSNIRTYLFASLFVAGNLILPQLCHVVPNGGLMLLPIYFFTLIAAYKYGLKVGLLTAVLSPVINFLLFGMPALAILPVILVKSGLLAVAAAYAAKLSGKVSLLAIAIAVLSYLLAGALFESMLSGSFTTAMQTLRVGTPGILIQVFGGFLVLKAIAKV